VQAGNEAAAVGFPATAVAVAEPDDVGAMLGQPGGEGQPLGVVDQRYLPGLAVVSTIVWN
jgi:hypothetical protein